MSQENQTALVCKTAAGDREAFERLLAMKKNFITYKILSIIKNQNDVEDIAQEVAMRLFQNMYSLKNPEAFNGWLGTIITRECLRYFEAKKKHFSIEDFTENEEIENRFFETDTDYLPSAHMERTELQGKIKTAIGHLPEQNRKMLQLHYESGKRCREIAAIMGLSTGVVCAYLYRARKRLQKELASVET